MATTLPNVRARVRIRLREADARRSSFGVVEIDQCIRDTYLTLQSRLPAAEVVATGGLTIASGADTFSLAVAASEEYAGEVRIQLQSDLSFLEKLTVEEIDRWRSRQASTYQGIPARFALWEDNATVIQGRVHPRANAAYVCNVFRGVVAADFDLTALDASSIAFSRYGLEALVLKSAANLAATLSEDDLKLRRLNPAAIQRWDRDAETVLYQEACRRHDIASVGRTQRNVS